MRVLVLLGAAHAWAARGLSGDETTKTCTSVAFSERIITTQMDPWLLFAIDVDGDGDVDVLAGFNYDDAVAWYRSRRRRRRAPRTARARRAR